MSMTQTKSKAELLARLPPEPDEAALLPDIRSMVDAGARKLVVIDDDPTGVQTVHDVALYLRWHIPTLASALRDAARLFFLLTNSRSMTGQEAERINRQTARMLAEASEETGVPFVIASRSDSTLRGHYPTELLALQDGLGHGFDGHLLVPAFFEGGRYTIDDTHYVATTATSEALTAASDTPFAQDRVFGYSTAWLPGWVEEKSGGAFKAEQVASLSLELIRKGGPQAVAAKLRQVSGGTTVVVNAAGYGDLAVVVLGLLQAESAGKTFLYRTGASFVRLRGAVEAQALLSASAILGVNRTSSTGGLVIIGSHVPGSTAQLERLLALPGVQGVELPATRAAASAEDAAALARDCGQRLEQIIRTGQVGALYTSRGLVTGNDDAATLEIGRRVSDALVGAVQAVATCPRFIIAKGGITSQVVAQHGLGADNARAIGQIQPGVPVWRLESGPRLRFPGIPYVVFPGNVGGPDSLAAVVSQLMAG